MCKHTNARADAATDSSDKWQGKSAKTKSQRARQKEATSEIMPYKN